MATIHGFTDPVLSALRAAADRPLLLNGATVHTFDPLIGTMRRADVLVGSGLVVGVGPGIVNAAEDDGALVVDATGTTIVPARPALIAELGGAGPDGRAGTLAPGADADLVVVDRDEAEPAAAVRTALTRPDHVLAALCGGSPVTWAGHVVGEPVPSWDPDAIVVDAHRVGVWTDTEGFLHQELTADGRYDETRGGRAHAFQGRYRVDGDRIDYLDDLGFWAFGRFDGETLHHAGYTMRRKDD